MQRDVPVVRLRDLVHGREPKACAYLIALCREERIERALPRRVVHADPGVRHGDEGVRYQRVERRLLEVELIGLLRADRELPPVGHRIARIDQQVHQQLMELPAVARHLEPAVDTRLDADAAMKGVARELDDVVAELGQVDLGVAALDLARETQQAARHLGSRGGGRANVAERLPNVAIADFGLRRSPFKKSILARTAPRRLLKSCATPVPSRPIASSLRRCATCSSIGSWWANRRRQLPIWMRSPYVRTWRVTAIPLTCVPLRLSRSSITYDPFSCLKDPRVHSRHERVVDLHVGLLAAAERQLVVDGVLVTGQIPGEHDDAGLLLLLGEPLLRKDVAPCNLSGIVSRHQQAGPQSPLDGSVQERRRV